MKIAAGEDGGIGNRGPVLGRAGGGTGPGMSSGREDQGIIDGGVDFDLHNLAAVHNRVANWSVDLGNAAQRIGILDAGAVAMRFANLAAPEQLAKIGGSFELS